MNHMNTHACFNPSLDFQKLFILKWLETYESGEVRGVLLSPAPGSPVLTLYVPKAHLPFNFCVLVFFHDEANTIDPGEEYHRHEVPFMRHPIRGWQKTWLTRMMSPLVPWLRCCLPNFSTATLLFPFLHPIHEKRVTKSSPCLKEGN